MDIRASDDDGTRNRPLSVWKERDSIRGRAVDALVMILDGPGCTWSKKVGCTMCGYNNNVDRNAVSEKELLMQVEYAMDRYESEPYIKIFTSGSFLDPNEIPKDAQISIISKIGDAAPSSRVLVESRPEFIEDKQLAALRRFVADLEVAIGLESSSDIIRARYIRKGFTYSQYAEGADLIIDSGCLLKTYLLLKPPLLGEWGSMEDAKNSIADIRDSFPGSRISVNPMNIQTNTHVERLFAAGLYRPPWLWSLVDVLRQSKKETGKDIHLMSSPTAGGKRRGAHNCGKCDDVVLSGIGEFSITNDVADLPAPQSCCYGKWESLLMSSRVDPLSADRT